MQPKSFSIRKLVKGDLFPGLLRHFDRYQQVTRCWRKQNGRWVLRDIAFIEQWSEGEKEDIVSDIFAPAIRGGGAVYGGFRLDGTLAGYAVVLPERFGSRRQYLQLKELYVSNECRQMGLGRALFEQAASFAKKQGAQKLYISAHSAAETQAFYRALGCTEAEEYSQALAALEPCDCQLEFDLYG